jgi:hypothetical protein
MSEFTKGKWEARPNRIIVDGRVLALVNGGNAANVRLIAAAPEMHELLKKTLNFLSEKDFDIQLKRDIDACLLRIDNSPLQSVYKETEHD